MSLAAMPKLLIRADANAQIGTGHVMRCLALAQSWKKRGGKVVFLGSSTPGLVERFSAEGFAWKTMFAEPGSEADASTTVEEVRLCGADCLVLDGYQFGAHYQKTLKASGLTLLVIDDYGHARHYYADYILNQNLGAAAALYQERERQTRLLLGNRYVLLRREFSEWRDRTRELPAVGRRLLVTMGGSDPNNTTQLVLQALKSSPDCEAIIIIGPANPRRAELETSISQSNLRAHLVSNPSNFPQLMAQADLAVSAAGSTCWELAFMGVPALLLVLAENQNAIARPLNTAGVALNLGPATQCTALQISQAIRTLLRDPKQRGQMSERGRTLIDGEGADRVVMQLSGDPLRLRRLRAEDCRLVWEWANEEAARAWSFSSEPIPWEAHQAWFGARLHDPKCVFYIGVDDQDQPMGQLRFDLRENNEAVISVSLAKAFRGRGLGLRLLDRGLRKFFYETQARIVHAWVKEKNDASLGAFEAAGFARKNLEKVKENLAWHFLFERQMMTPEQ